MMTRLFNHQKTIACIVKWYQLRSEVSVFVWGVGGRGSSGTSGGEEERVGQDLEQARIG